MKAGALLKLHAQIVAMPVHQQNILLPFSLVTVIVIAYCLPPSYSTSAVAVAVLSRQYVGPA